MLNGNIYWFTGQPSHGKTVLGKKLVELLQTEKRNWRKPVFHIDDDVFGKLGITNEYANQTSIDNIRNVQMISEYLFKNGCDVVVSLVTPHRWLREEFKQKIGLDNFQEFYVHTNRNSDGDYLKVDGYEKPEINFMDVDITKDNPDKSFNKIVNYLKENNKL